MRKDIWIPAVFLAAAAAVIAGTALLSTRGDAAIEKRFGPMQPVRIAIAADLHYLSPALTDGGQYFTQLITNADGKLMQFSDEIAEALTAGMCAEKPDVLILPGDLTFNGARESHAALIEKLRRISDAGVGALAARAAVLGAGLNVKINAASLKDRAKADALIAEAEALACQADAEERAIMEEVNRRLAES